MHDVMKALSSLCVADDQDFISDHTNTIAARVETLKETTESRKELLETRLESWKVFPVEEAIQVQQFLDNLALEVTEEEDEEECSGEELLEKLKRLEVSACTVPHSTAIVYDISCIVITTMHDISYRNFYSIH